MRINQVAELAGITSKNIRFYENRGLIRPGRNPENGYREYSLEDVNTLSRIKLLRQLDISCDSIKKLENGELDFDMCMSEHVKKLREESSNLEHMISICLMLHDDADDFSDIDASLYLEKMKELEKGGARFVNVQLSDTNKRKIGAILAGGIVIAVMLVLLAVIVWADSEDPAPLGIFIFAMVCCASVPIGVAIALKQRLDELKKGEIDEADKY